MKNEFESLRQQWEVAGTKRLDLRSQTKADINANEEVQLKNMLVRMDDLAAVLYHIFILYQQNPDVYGDRLLAFVGNSVVREWPYKDPVFTSEAAYEIINAHGCYDALITLPADAAKKSFKSVTSQLTFEHWTPISFFRDIFKLKRSMSVEAFAVALKQNYRTVWITKEEDKRLGKNSRSFRAIADYEKHNINIKERSRWSLLMKLSEAIPNT